jgi:ATP-binding cassette subfamily B (MDR/TAP) protein 1
MHLVLLLLILTLGAIASQSTPPSPPSPPTIRTSTDVNSTTDISKDQEWHVYKQPVKINPRFMSGGFLDKCKDVRQGYKSSPWLVAKCPDKNGKYLCTWLELGKCLLNIDGDLQRGPMFQARSMFQCRTWLTYGS